MEAVDTREVVLGGFVEHQQLQEVKCWFGVARTIFVLSFM